MVPVTPPLSQTASVNAILRNLNSLTRMGFCLLTTSGRYGRLPMLTMRFPVRLPLLVLLAALATGAEAWAQGQPGRRIEYAEPKEENGGSVSMNPSQSRLGMLENELNRPFQNLSPGRSLDGMILSPPLPAPPPPPRSSREQDLNNKRWEWMYRSAEDMMSVESPDKKYQAPELTADGRDRSKLRPMERAYYDALYSDAASAATNQFYGSSSPTFIGTTPGFSTLPGSLNPGENFRQRNPQMNPGLTTPRSTDATDFSSFGRNPGLPAKPSQAQIDRANQFRELYNFSGSPLPSASPSSSYIYTSPYANRSFEAPKPQTTVPAPTLNTTVNGAGLGTLTPYAPPASQPARSSAPASPFMNITRSGF